jgi:hypothetical protein
MHPFQKKKLREYCRRYSLDTHLIDSKLTYAENKAYLRSQITDFGARLEERWSEDEIKEWDSAEEDYFCNHFLMYYVLCIRDGSTRSAIVGESDTSAPQFSLREHVAMHK